MSQPLAPRPVPGGDDNAPGFPSSHRSRKISTACGACKQRKIRCSGGTPCEGCSSRGSQCIYDITSDQRRKIANQRNVQDLDEARQDLERHRQLLGGIIATVRAGDDLANDELVRIIRSGVDLSQLAAHVRNECRSNIAIQNSFEQIEFIIDGGDVLPPPSQVLQEVVLDSGFHPNDGPGGFSTSNRGPPSQP